MAWEGQLIDLSVMRLSPFSYAHYTITELALLPLFGLIGLTAILTGIGLAGFNRRSVG